MLGVCAGPMVIEKMHKRRYAWIHVEYHTNIVDVVDGPLVDDDLRQRRCETTSRVHVLPLRLLKAPTRASA